MFLKTLKHDLKNSFKDYAMLYLTMIVFAILAPIGVRADIELLNVLVAMMFSFVVFGSVVLIFMNIVNFIKRRLFDDGAYLTLTLPVSIETTLISKIISITIWMIVSIVIMLISLLIIGWSFADYAMFAFNQIKIALEYALSHIQWWQWALSIIHSIISFFVFICLVILVMAIVNTSWFKKSNYFISILLFIVATWIRTIFDGVLAAIISPASQEYTYVLDEGLSMFGYAGDPLYMGVQIFYELIWFMVLFMAIRYLFTKKLEI